MGCVQENGVHTAIQAIYRDLEYARSLIKPRPAKPGAFASAVGDAADEGEIEENWTFIGDESDPEIQRRIHDWESPRRGRAPRVSMDGAAGLRAMQGVEAVRKPSVTRGRGRG